jgi:hypothetical protein
VISGFRREVVENCALLCCYAASSGNFLLMFRENLWVPSPGFKNPKKEKKMDSSPLKVGPIGFPGTSVRNYHYSPRNNPEERGSHNLNYSDGWNSLHPFGRNKL